MIGLNVSRRGYFPRTGAWGADTQLQISIPELDYAGKKHIHLPQHTGQCRYS